MTGWKEALRRLVAQVERGIDEQRRARPAADARPEIHPFRGYGTHERLHVTGRVLRQPRIAPAQDRGSAWANVLESYRRLASAEVPGAVVTAEYRGITEETTTDDEGYFHVSLDIGHLATGDELLHRVALRLTEPSTPGETIAEVLVPPASARFGVISDIDDTIVETNATSLVRMVRTVFAQNARGRTPMEGVAAFYRRLHDGFTGSERNPIFYVSSSPWNFYDLLDQFLAIHAIPPGPLMLQDYGLDDAKWIHSAHDDHKLRQIDEILTTYPALPFVLIGDSGQRDPEIYRQVAIAHRQRIRAVYIRDVTTTARDGQVRAIAADVTAAGVPVVLVETTDDAVAHAVSVQLIR